jgi:precorrin isomerase
MEPNKTPLIQSLLAHPMDGAAIEEKSLATIDAEAPAHHFAPEEWAVVRRMIHSTADFTIADCVRFSPGAIDAAKVALASGAPIYADSNMIRAGLSLARLRRVSSLYDQDRICCHVADAAVAAQARTARLPRSLFAVRKARQMLDGAIAIFGNAPVALLELNRMVIEEGIRPALVIAMPVGFVHVVESKQELMALDLAWIATEGRRGGSTLAVAALHALCELCNPQKGGSRDEEATQNRDRVSQGLQGPRDRTVALHSDGS